MTGSEVARREESAVPALAQTPATELTAEDVSLSAIKLGQHMSNHVQDGAVPAGCIFATTGPDDPDPVVLWEQGDKEPLVFHVLGLRKGKSVSIDGELELYAFDDPNAPADAWTTYNYVVALPGHDEDMPYKLLLTKTGKPAAQSINTVVAKNPSTPAYKLAFSIDCVQRENAKGKFFVPRVRHVEATDEGTALAEKLLELVPQEPAPAPAEARADEPAI